MAPEIPLENQRPADEPGRRVVPAGFEGIEPVRFHQRRLGVQRSEKHVQGVVGADAVHRFPVGTKTGLLIF